MKMKNDLLYFVSCVEGQTNMFKRYERLRILLEFEIEYIRKFHYQLWQFSRYQGKHITYLSYKILL